ncbi:MAG: hypothetical protein M1816_003307 [Peltula sp. TS41687]|nr:MAG: hypothetical protein M1816_003307 [Peltula sp. TS41687]
MTDTFSYDRDRRILVCLTHHRAILPHTLKSHLQQQHRSQLTSAEREQLIARTQRDWPLAEPSTISPPDPNGPPIPSLEVFLVSTDPSGSLGEPTDAWTSLLPSEEQQPFETYLEDDLDAFEAVDPGQSHVEETPWLRRTGFPHHLEECDKRMLALAASGPNPKAVAESDKGGNQMAKLEKRLGRFYDHTVTLMVEWNRWADPNHERCRISSSVARLLNSFQSNTTAVKPLQPTSTTDSIKKYGAMWACGFYYAVRLLSLHPAQGHDSYSMINEDRWDECLPTLKGTSEQQTWVRKVN